MSEDDAPDTLTLTWCPMCGRHDRYNHLRRAGYPHNQPSGGRCKGDPVLLTYALVLPGRAPGSPAAVSSAATGLADPREASRE